MSNFGISGFPYRVWPPLQQAPLNTHRTCARPHGRLKHTGSAGAPTSVSGEAAPQRPSSSGRQRWAVSRPGQRGARQHCATSGRSRVGVTPSTAPVDHRTPRRARGGLNDPSGGPIGPDGGKVDLTGSCRQRSLPGPRSLSPPLACGRRTEAWADLDAIRKKIDVREVTTGNLFGTREYLNGSIATAWQGR